MSNESNSLGAMRAVGGALRGALLVATLMLVLLVATGVRAASESTDLGRLVHRADHVLRGDTTAAVIKMHVHTGSYDREYSLVYWADDRGGHDRALVKVLGPARWRGHGTLKVDGRLSVYDPRTDRVTVLSSSMLGDSWMGSHFTNDDLVKETDLAKDYTPTLLRRWDATVDGKEAHFYRLRLVPTPRAPVSWHHIVAEVYTQGKAVIPTSQAYFRGKGQKKATRTLTFDQVESVGDRIAPTRLTMRVASKPGEFTEVKYEKVRFDVDVPRSKFVERALRQ